MTDNIKILTIIGARPQFIKAAAVSREISKRRNVGEIIVHTGQHFDANMSDIFFDEMDIPKPDYHLNVNNLSHGAMTGKMLEQIEQIIIKESPGFVMVYGDTNSTIAGALAAVKLHVPVAHVEAGLRSFNMRMPEEINRIVTDRISTILFCPTQTAIQNLQNEGFEKNRFSKFVLSGDVMYDAARYYAASSTEKSNIIDHLNLSGKQFVLATIHRAENTDDPSRLLSIFDALDVISETTEIVMPIHPRTRKYLSSINRKSSNIRMIDPVGYFDMLEFLKHCSLVITDSGGLQKEAFFFAKPCVTVRDETEWTELVDHGFNRLAGSDKDKIIEYTRMMINTVVRNDTFLYGKGDAGTIIIDEIINSCEHSGSHL